VRFSRALATGMGPYEAAIAVGYPDAPSATVRACSLLFARSAPASSVGTQDEDRTIKKPAPRDYNCPRAWLLMPIHSSGVLGLTSGGTKGGKARFSAHHRSTSRLIGSRSDDRPTPFAGTPRPCRPSVLRNRWPMLPSACAACRTVRRAGRRRLPPCSRSHGRARPRKPHW
jgi:hypothetical protein